MASICRAHGSFSIQTPMHGTLRRGCKQRDGRISHLSLAFFASSVFDGLSFPVVLLRSKGEGGNGGGVYIERNSKGTGACILSNMNAYCISVSFLSPVVVSGGCCCLIIHSMLSVGRPLNQHHPHLNSHIHKHIKEKKQNKTLPASIRYSIFVLFLFFSVACFSLSLWL